MAEENKTPAKAQKNWFLKLIDWFKSLPGRIAAAFKNMVAELRKVTWPSKKKWISSCITVLLFMLFMGVVIGLLDMGSRAAVDGLYELSHPVVATEVPAEDPTVDPAADAAESVEATAEPTEAPTAEPAE